MHVYDVGNIWSAMKNNQNKGTFFFLLRRAKYSVEIRSGSKAKVGPPERRVFH